MVRSRVIIVGGGAAGCFAAITCAETAPQLEVTVLEQSAQFLGKVRISGGGRCNVTHACFDPRELAERYPRGGQELIGPFQRFQPTDTMAWFKARGVALKTEEDGRVFPVSDRSQTIVECLLGAARRAGVRLQANATVERIQGQGAGFDLRLADGRMLEADRVMLATGGCRGPVGGRMAEAFGHTIEPPVPSLFTFVVECPWLRELAGVAVTPVSLRVPGTALAQSGPLLLTHWGVSGPAVLRLSAWGARVLHEARYVFPLQISWLPERGEASLERSFQEHRRLQGARQVAKTPWPPMPGRLWERLVLAAGLPADARWSGLSREQQHRLHQQLTRSQFAVVGKSLNKDEFVTCGGVRLAEVNFKTMESRRQPGLYFGGELLDIDGLTGGFNFQAAWTTGWIAGRAMAGA